MTMAMFNFNENNKNSRTIFLNSKIKMEVNEPNFDKIYNLKDRLVRFAGESIFFVRKLDKAFELDYYKN